MSEQRKTIGRTRRYVIVVEQFGIGGARSKRELAADERRLLNTFAKAVRDVIRVGPYSKAVTARIEDPEPHMRFLRDEEDRP